MNARLAWDLVPTFLTLAEQLHYGQAAARLGISRQALSKRINRLEQEIGVPLVVRSTRRVGLTDAGIALRDDAIPAVVAMRHAIERARSDASTRRLAIGVSTDLPDSWAERVQRWIVARGEPALSERRAPDDAVRLLRRGELDLALVATAVAMLTLPPGDKARALAVGREPAVALLPAVHPAAARDAISPGDLDDLPVMVAEADGPEERRATIARLQGDAERPHLIAPRIGTIAQGLVAAARDHHGAALVQERGLAGVALDGLVARPLQPPQSFTVLLLARAGPQTRPFAALAEHLLLER
ncbi:LysR family transcriptional regulator [Conexibacter sp. JD483]|uniref:LysR family transcriptional regulator n=1 Tax=unclassified Conexibacter TaxID=2627773 RepID=UPI0027253FE7|nr:MULTISPECIES: LysR family transcriptional regulator [unclassified Conexibacter]MDO8186716.1 LysR family transcriptional regulator [Conexibacter sp. CPCC 205706]MDO8199002.1 LysR family transcriptional regulator [Conexibacter sp. CPCC 205762]MDR9368454.1 LysR family transcriptional regulator [Conexibacter sp. JD483]